ncbi:MAG: hypothetical protein GY708_28375 [Actinomycetia bacterium]|nr:hypothetical protein [Actinomycetes bacterium]MCP4959525.1 hypothetical protein [Actinomycetes bacterium]
MALVNVKKKVEKARSKLGLLPGEEVLGGCTTNPSGTMKRMLARELGGAIASAVAGRGVGEPVDGGVAAQFPSGQCFVCLTDRRMIVTNVSAMTGSPKQIVAEFPKDQILAIQADKGLAAMPLNIAFTDGSAVQVEGAKMSNPGGLVELFASWGTST